MSSHIKPIARALAILRALNYQPHSSLLELHRATNLPKPTVHRLLATLKAEGYVRSDVARGVYSLTSKVRELSEGFTSYELVVEVGRPFLIRATRESGVPMAIGVQEGGRIVVRYSSMPYSPIAPEHTTLGHTHDLLYSAMGQAYLANCSSIERIQLEHQLTKACSGQESEQQVRMAISQAITQTRKRGYGLRLPEGSITTGTMAVPILHPDRLLGVLYLTTFGRLMDTSARQSYALLLDKTSAEISGCISGEWV